MKKILKILVIILKNSYMYFKKTNQNLKKNFISNVMNSLILYLKIVIFIKINFFINSLILE